LNRLEYNAFDCLATRQVFERLYPMLDDETRRVYEAEMGLQGVCLGVQLEGILIDQTAKYSIQMELEKNAHDLDKSLEELVGRTVNPRSVSQIKAVLYEDCHLAIQRNSDTGEPTTNGETLEKIKKGAVSVAGNYSNAEKHAFKQKAAAIAGVLLQYRDLEKQLETLRAATHNGRMRTTLTVGGTESYRLSATKSHRGDGVNIQNQDKRLRRMYIPDPGFDMVQMDQERAESLTVAHCSGDPAYIAAHRRENTHVAVARLLWPKMPWKGDASDKALAKSLTPEGKPVEGAGRASLYDLAKSIQHGLNYLLTPAGLARHTHLSEAAAQNAYEAYFSAFPGIKAWHEAVIQEVRETGIVHCPGGYRRIFFGRRNDRATWREAISFIPQSVVAWTNHIVFKRLYYQLGGDDFKVLAHGHDSILFQVRQEMWPDYRPHVEALSRVTWPTKGGKMTIPFEMKIGRNWAEVS
jgi:DNA polymerase-1